jgi:hypothetical protein
VQPAHPARQHRADLFGAQRDDQVERPVSMSSTDFERWAEMSMPSSAMASTAWG